MLKIYEIINESKNKKELIGEQQQRDRLIYSLERDEVKKNIEVYDTIDSLVNNKVGCRYDVPMIDKTLINTKWYIDVNDSGLGSVWIAFEIVDFRAGIVICKFLEKVPKKYEKEHEVINGEFFFHYQSMTARCSIYPRVVYYPKHYIWNIKCDLVKLIPIDISLKEYERQAKKLNYFKDGKHGIINNPKIYK